MSRIAVGLPSNPRARLASSPSPHPPPTRGRPQGQLPSPRTEAPRSLRSASAARPRQVETYEFPTKDVRRIQSRSRPGHDGNRSARRTSISSTSTTSSGGSSSSSLWERGSERSYSTAASEDVPEPEQKAVINTEGSVLGSLLDTTYYWNRATEAASALSQGVSSAWSTGVASQLESDHPEDDSHLLKVMRAYHLSKARTPSELPDWLFDERERGTKAGFAHVSSIEVSSDTPSRSKTQTQRRRYGQVSQPTQFIPSQEFPVDKEPTYFRGSPEPIPSRLPDGVNRLKTLRDRQRNAPAKF
ncbi:hypothetical protein CPB83DRAFT_846634 [Crepidotus variabilis]|uniref:Uncharacterized protein n=1 Tax=Crepidotus variabilis TaxID=179855 RepID=A0A9P6EPK6_9AGAR|nr:hypothetical protein CPB83DRAFT_846634 [Crepidotus variabilis]